MKYLPLGDSGLSASVIGFGAWAIGGGAVWGDSSDDAESLRTIAAALDAGINLLDTAPAYGWGHSERLIAESRRGPARLGAAGHQMRALVGRFARGSFFTNFNGRDIYRSLRPDTIAIEVERSLRDLGTDRIDLYQIHWPAVEPEKTPVEDTMAALLKLREQGKIRAIGVCNLSAAELARIPCLRPARQPPVPLLDALARSRGGDASVLPGSQARHISPTCRLSKGCSPGRSAWTTCSRKASSGATRMVPVAAAAKPPPRSRSAGRLADALRAARLHARPARARLDPCPARRHPCARRSPQGPPHPRNRRCRRSGAIFPTTSPR